VLKELFPRFVFLGRENRYVSNFEIEFAPGAAVAWLSHTAVLDTSRTVIRVRLEGSPVRPVTWKLTDAPSM
jgi:hypothetical protein